MTPSRWIALCALGGIGLAGVPVAHAGESDIATLRQQVKALNAMVLELRQRVDRLEGEPSPESRAAPVAPVSSTAPVTPAAAAPVTPSAGYMSPEATLRQSWARVQPDMPQDEVAQILGAPSKKLTLDGRVVWYYHYPATGNGSIFFTDAGRVSSRQSPFGWGW